MPAAFSELFAQDSSDGRDVIQVESLIRIVSIVNLDVERVENGDLRETTWPGAEPLITVEVDFQVLESC